MVTSTQKEGMEITQGAKHRSHIITMAKMVMQLSEAGCSRDSIMWQLGLTEESMGFYELVVIELYGNGQ